MKNVLKAVMISTLILLGLTTVNISNAVEPTGTMKLEQTESTTKYNIGDTVTIKLSLTGLNGSTGINIIAGQLVYDEDTLEYIAMDNLNSWVNPIYDANTKRFTIDRSTEMVSGDILQIRFKLKAIPSSNTSNFKIRDLDCSDDENAIEMNGTNEVSINVTIEEVTTNPGENTNVIPDTETNTETNTTTNTTNTDIVPGINKVNTATANSQSKANTQSPGKLPQAGETFGMVIAIVFVISIAVALFVKYRNIEIK